jgi:O-6-methylguanine DNA methyltransferase
MNSHQKKSFIERVHEVVKRIPRGKVLTYAQVAVKAGHPKAFRAVGNVLTKNFDPTIPCHRVIRSDGTLGGYNRGVKAKEKILKAEGYLK